MFHRLILTLILLLHGYTFIFCKNTDRVQPRKDSFVVHFEKNYTLTEQLEFVHYAEEARSKFGTNLTGIAGEMGKKVNKVMGLRDSYCIVQTQPIHARYATDQKMIYLRTDTADNLRILCVRINKANHLFYTI